jgi:hypothetical protein
LSAVLVPLLQKTIFGDCYLRGAEVPYDALRAPKQVREYDLADVGNPLVDDGRWVQDLPLNTDADVKRPHVIPALQVAKVAAQCSPRSIS